MTRAFRIGDKVRQKPQTSFTFQKGIWTVMGVYDDMIAAEYGKDFELGHNCRGVCKDKRGLFISRTDLIKEEETLEQLIYLLEEKHDI